MSDPFIYDSNRNKEYPALQESKVIKSSDSDIYLIIQLAEGKGPHPTLFFFYGYPGDEKNYDIAHLLRRAGFNCIIFFYQGSWGSKGNYSVKNCIDDGMNVINYIKDNSKKFRVNTNKLYLLGYSMGGFYAIMTSLKTHIKSIILISNFNPNPIYNNKNEKQRMKKLLSAYSFPLRFDTDNENGKEIINDLENDPSYDFINYIQLFDEYNILLIGAEEDEVLPPNLYYKPILSVFKKNKRINLNSELLLTGHSYSDHRIKLSRAILNWLIISS